AKQLVEIERLAQLRESVRAPARSLVCREAVAVPRRPSTTATPHCACVLAKSTVAPGFSRPDPRFTIRGPRVISGGCDRPDRADDRDGSRALQRERVRARRTVPLGGCAGAAELPRRLQHARRHL